MDDADRSGFEAIMRDRQAQVMRIAYRMLGNWADAEDVAQEAFVRLHRHCASAEFPDAEAAGAWTCRVAVNLCLDRIRSRSRWRMTGDIPELATSGESAEDSTLLTEQKRMLGEAVARLPERERAAVVLREIEGWSTEETARMLGSSEATVRSQVSKGIVRLREWMTGKR